MNLYPWIVLTHVTAVMLFFIAHGAPAMVGLRLRTELAKLIHRSSKR